jgi:hypothetical protein
MSDIGIWMGGVVAFAGLTIVLISLMGRLNGRDDNDPDTILIPPIEEEPLGEQVDVRSLMRRWEDEK